VRAEILEQRKNRKQKKTIYWERRAAGLCYYCGAPADGGLGSCQKCRDNRKGTPPRVLVRRKALAALGICISCGKAEAMPGRQKCGYCQEYHDEATKKYRERRRQEGKCSTCGAHDPEPGYRRCKKCIAANRRAKARMKARRDSGYK
jgi:hypothetical protein